MHTDIPMSSFIIKITKKQWRVERVTNGNGGTGNPLNLYMVVTNKKIVLKGNSVWGHPIKEFTSSAKEHINPVHETHSSSEVLSYVNA